MKTMMENYKNESDWAESVVRSFVFYRNEPEQPSYDIVLLALSILIMDHAIGLNALRGED